GVKRTQRREENLLRLCVKSYPRLWDVAFLILSTRVRVSVAKGPLGSKRRYSLNSVTASFARPTRRRRLPLSKCAPPRSGLRISARFTSSYDFSSDGFACVRSFVS